MSSWSRWPRRAAVAGVLGLSCGGKVELRETGATHDGGRAFDAPTAAADANASSVDAADGKTPRIEDLRFRKIATGSERYCGITEPDARLVCVKDEKIVTDREGPYVDVSMSEELGWDYTCAVRASGDLECLSSSGVIAPPTGTYTQVSVGFFSACAAAVDRSVACWIPAELGGVEPPEGLRVIAPLMPPFNGSTLSVNMGHGCTIGDLFHLSCFGSNVSTPRISFHYFALAVAPKRACAITFPDEELWCWPASTDGADSGEKMLEGQSQSLAVNLNGEGCGVTRQGDIRCWGAADYQPPAGALGPFQAISIGGPQACALSTDGRAICWKARPR